MGKSTILLFVLSLFTACSGTKDVKEDAGTIILEAGFEGGGKNTNTLTVLHPVSVSVVPKHI